MCVVVDAWRITRVVNAVPSVGVRGACLDMATFAGKQVDENCAPIFESSVAAAATCSTSALLQIFHVLFKPIHSILSGLSKLEVWGTAPTQRTNPSGFSSPPSDYIHGIAQSLLDVPTMVQEGSLSTAAASELWEVLAGGALDMSTSGAKTKLAPVRIAGLVKAIDAEEDEEQAGVGAEDEEDAAYNWLVLVAKGTVAMLLAQVDAIPRLTEQGATQLAADLSHWAKVLGAGEMEPGPVLLQVRTCICVSATMATCYRRVAVRSSLSSCADVHLCSALLTMLW